MREEIRKKSRGKEDRGRIERIEINKTREKRVRKVKREIEV